MKAETTKREANSKEKSSLAYQKLGSQHSTLTSKNLNKLKNQQLSLDPSEK